MYNTMNVKPGFQTKRAFHRHPMHSAPTVLANVVENDDHYLIQMAVPGYKKDQIAVTVTDNVLHINGTLNHDNQEQQFIRKEFAVGDFTRKFTLPKGTNLDNISAECDNGILFITIGKMPEAQPIKVTIQ